MYRLVFVGLFLAIILPMNLQAGGICLYEIAPQDVGYASAGWSARADDAATVFTNPAGMVRLNEQIEFGAEPIYVSVNYDPNDQTTVSGEHGRAKPWIPSGSFFYVKPINDCLTFGFASLGYFGAQLKYNHDWVGRYYVTEAILQGFSFVPAAALKISDSLSIGVGANSMYAILDQKAAVHNLLDQLPDGQLKIKDSVWGIGALVGILYQMTPCTRFGIQYLSEVKLRFRDRPHFTDVGPILESILLRGGVLGSRVTIRANVPQTVIISAYHDLDDCWSIMGDIGWQQWSRFQKATISLANPNDTTLTFVPKYEDTWHVAAGAKYRYSCRWTLFGGVAYDSSMVNNKNRPFDLPVGKQWRFGFGGEWQYSENLFFDFCYELQWQGNLPAERNRGILAGHVDGEFNRVYAHFFDVNVKWVF